jgi:alkylation response protein AidB-like acyl-CoA dehydrogenase
MGGLGLGLRQLGAMFGAVGQGLLPGPLVAHAIVVPRLMGLGTPQIQEQIELALDGKTIVSLVRGQDPPWGDGVAQVRRSGNRLFGEVALVEFGEDADWLIVVCEGDGRPELIFVSANEPQVEIRSQPSYADDIKYGTVVFDGVELSEENVLLSADEAGMTLNLIRAESRLMDACEIAGSMGALTRLTTEYTKNRFQFGRAIGGFQAVKHMLANTYAKTVALQVLCDEMCLNVDQRDVEIEHAGQVCLALAARSGRKVGETCLQLHGGIGFTAESYVHHYLKRILRLQGARGDGAELELEIGRKYLTSMSR